MSLGGKERSGIQPVLLRGTEERGVGYFGVVFQVFLVKVLGSSGEKIGGLLIKTLIKSISFQFLMNGHTLIRPIKLLLI